MFLYHVVGTFLTSHVASSLFLRSTKTATFGLQGLAWVDIPSVTESSFASMSKWMVEEQEYHSCRVKACWAQAPRPCRGWSRAPTDPLICSFRVTAPGVDYEADEEIVYQFLSWNIFLFFSCWVTCKILPLFPRGKITSTIHWRAAIG